MTHRLMPALGLVMAALLTLVAGPALADTVGPYYAAPSWDQTLPSNTRFVVLSNFGGAAVLDRESGLVWEKSPDLSPRAWDNARNFCVQKSIGSRMGWRLPSLPEISSLLITTQSNSALPAGHPFNVPVPPGITEIVAWTATTDAGSALQAWQVGIADVSFPTVQLSVQPKFTNGFATEGFVANFFAWCVRGPMNADQY